MKLQELHLLAEGDVDGQVIDRFALTTANQAVMHLTLVAREGELVWVCQTKHGTFDIRDTQVVALVYLHFCCKSLAGVSQE